MAATIEHETLYSADEVGAIINRSPITLGKWRRVGEGPDFIKPCGARGAILYRGSDLTRWLDSRCVKIGAGPEQTAA